MQIVCQSVCLASLGEFAAKANANKSFNRTVNAGGNALLSVVTLVVTPRYHQHTVWRNTWAQPATPKNK